MRELHKGGALSVVRLIEERAPLFIPDRTPSKMAYHLLFLPKSQKMQAVVGTKTMKSTPLLAHIP